MSIDLLDSMAHYIPSKKRTRVRLCGRAPTPPSTMEVWVEREVYVLFGGKLVTSRSERMKALDITVETQSKSRRSSGRGKESRT
jgi:hypothetical protein